jgi:tetratricopeptide (TPR) repeat protein
MTAKQNENLPRKILVVDDDESITGAVKNGLEKYEITVDTASILDTAFYLFNQNRYDVVLVELEFAPLPGLALIQKWRRHENIDKRSTSIILLSGQKRSAEDASLISELGDAEVLVKPFSMIQLLPFLARGVVAKSRLAKFMEIKERVLDHYIKNQAFDTAAEFVKKRIKEFGPKGIDLLLELYEKAGRYEDALALTDSLISSNQGNIAMLNARGRFLMMLGRHGEALEYLEKADRLAPRNIERINQLATLYLHLKNPQESVRKMNQLIGLNPEDPDFKFELYGTLYDFGYDEEACEFGKQTSSPIEIVRHYNNKGVILSKDGRREEAMQDYLRAVKFYPKFKENYRIYYNMALACTSTKTRPSYEKALEYLQKCLELSPEFDKAQRTRDVVLKALNSSGAQTREVG